jgi:guanylate kinase
MLNRWVVPKELMLSWPYGQLFIISAPAGAGKTTLVKYLVAAFPNVVQTPSLTTRSRRDDEIDGKDYHFVSKEEFLKRESEGDLLEHVELHGHLYGTSRKEIEHARLSGHHVIIVLDTRGALALKHQLKPILIFIKTPTIDTLKERLVRRASEDQKSMEMRLSWAQKELSDEKHFHYSIINDDLQNALHVLASIIIAESHKIITMKEEPCSRT